MAVYHWGHGSVWLGATENANNCIAWVLSGRGVDEFKKCQQSHQPICLAADVQVEKWRLDKCHYPRVSLCERKLEKASCTNQSDCSIHAHCSLEIFSLSNNDHGDMTCHCMDGFYGNGSVCHDMDECQTNLDDCHFRSQCLNTHGSYKCQCYFGWIGDGKNCFLPIRGVYNHTSTYFVNEEEVNSCFSANKKCQEFGGSLVSFETEDEWNLAANNLSMQWSSFML